MIKNLKIATFGVLVGTFATNTASAGQLYGGACTTQGSWTQAAIYQAQQIKDVVAALKDDPKCKGIEQIVPKLTLAEGQLQVPRDGTGGAALQLESISGEVQALRQYMFGPGRAGAQRPQVATAIVGKTLDGLTAANDASQALAGKALTIDQLRSRLASLKARSGAAAEVGLSLLNQTMAILPQYERCLNGHPNQAGAMVGATLKMAAAFMGNHGMTAKAADTVANFVTFMRDMKYAKIMRKLEENEYWSSVSCLIETTSNAYCSAEDAYSLLDYQKRERDLQIQLRNAKQKNPNMDNPLEGYYLMVHEMPAINEWLQRVRFGTKPKLMIDATLKETNNRIVADFLTHIAKLQALHAERTISFQTLPDADAKRTEIVELVRKLYDITGREERDTGGGVVINFFKSAVNRDLMPFWFIGMDRQPQETIGGGGRTHWDMWMSNGGQYRPELADPDRTLIVIKERLDVMIQKAQETASSWSRKQMIVDSANLVNESLTSTSGTVIDSLRRVDNYLTKLIPRFDAAWRAKRVPVTILPSVRQTQMKIRQVLQAYEEINKVEEWYVQQAGGPNGNLTPAIQAEFDKRTRAAYDNVTETAFREFDIMVQQESFLATRMSTFVRYDFADRVRTGTNMNEAQRQLLIVSGKNLLDRFAEINRNPNDSRMDLANAQVLNRRNILAVEELFGKSMEHIINELNKVIGGTVKRSKLMSGLLIGLMSQSGGLGGYAPIVARPMPAGAEEYAKYRKAPKHMRVDDPHGAHKMLKAKLCLQTLGFKNWQKFEPLCRGAVLVSEFEGVTTAIPLSTSYDNMVKQMLADSKAKGLQPAQVQAPGVCALRNHVRYNYAHWLVEALNVR